MEDRMSCGRRRSFVVIEPVQQEFDRYGRNKNTDTGGVSSLTAAMNGGMLSGWGFES